MLPVACSGSGMIRWKAAPGSEKSSMLERAIGWRRRDLEKKMMRAREVSRRYR